MFHPLKILPLLLLIPTLAIGQDDLYPPERLFQSADTSDSDIHHFVLSPDNKLYYQHVFESTLPETELVTALTHSYGAGFRSFTVQNYGVNFKALHYDYMALPFSISTANLIFHVSIQVKNFRYRVTVTDISSALKRTMTLSGVSSSDSDYDPLESSLFRKDGSYKISSKYGLRCLSDSFDSYFDVSQKVAVLAADDW